MSYVPFKPRASLTKVVGSHLDGSNNWRRGGAQCVMVSSDVPRSAHHRTPRVFKECGSFETPTLNQPLTAESQSIQLDQRPVVADTECIHLDPPSLQTSYKRQGLVQLENSLAFQDGNDEFYINDDMDAAYLVEEHSKLKGTIEGVRVEVTGAQAHGRPLSVLLRYIGCLKTIAFRKEAEPANRHGYVEFAMSVDRRVEEMSEFSGEEMDSDAGDQRTDAILNRRNQQSRDGRRAELKPALAMSAISKD